MKTRAKIATFILAAQFIVALLMTLVFAIGLEISDDTTAALFIGSLMTQILLTAVWTTMAPVNLPFRVATGMLFTLFFVVCFYRIAWRDGGGHDVALAICIPMLIQWVLLQLPLWFARFRGWRVGVSGHSVLKPRNDRSEFQFGIKQILIWTTLVAFSVAVIKSVLRDFDLDFSSRNGQGMVEIGLFLTVGNSLIALPIIWGAFVHRLAWIWYLISLVVCAAVCLVEFTMIAGPATQDGFLYIINITQTLLAMIAMAIVRQLGFRLQQMD